MTYGALLKRKEFSLFLITQFLGAFNDNIYKMLVSLLVVHGALSGEFLSITAIVFILPSLFFSGYAGFLADRYSKRDILIITKACEIIAMICAFFALGIGSTFLMLVVLFMTATQSAFFSPAKYGIVPETMSQAELSCANGLLQMSTYVAILLGGVVGGLLLSIWQDALHVIGLILILISVLGTLCSFGIAHVQAASTRELAVNPWAEIVQGCKELRKSPLLCWVVLAIAYFWALGLAMQINLVALGHFSLNWDPLSIAFLQMMLGVGIGVGSLLAGKMSGDQIEPGLIPLGAVLMGLSLLWLADPYLSATMIYLVLTLLGMAAGFYIVPLNALLQTLPEGDQKGRMIATANFLGAAAMLVSAGLTWVFYTVFGFSPRELLVMFGGFTLLLAILAIKLFPDFFLRLLIWIITHTLYRVRTIGRENVPSGAALLVCNHVSYVDGMILSASLPRFVRYLVLKDFYENKLLNWLFKLAHAIPIKEGEYEMTLSAFEKAREALRQGHVVCIFAEGAITRTGHLLPFRKGFERVMQDVTDVPIIPVYIDALWESIFAYRGGEVIWKLPRQMPIHVTLAFGAPLPSDSKAAQVRRAVQELGSEVKFKTQNPEDILSLRLLRTARWRYFKLCMVDGVAGRVTYGQFIGMALLLARYLRSHYALMPMIGVLLPPGVAAAVVNVAMTLAGKTVINFPYSNFKVDWQYFIDEGHVSVVISSREFLATHHELPSELEIVFYEDLAGIAEKKTKTIAQMAALWLPASWVLAFYGKHERSPDAAAAVCFSRGTQDSVQGAVLTHRNIIANVQSYAHVLHLKRTDRMMGVLPFASAHGYSLNLWLPLIHGMAVVYQADPILNCETMGRLMSQYKVSVIFDTLEDYQAYLENIRPSRFSYIRHAVVIGQPIPDVLARAFEEQFGLELLESYGCVEMGPGIAINVPDVRRPGRLQRGTKAGSVGHPLPGVAVKIVDPHTGKEVENGQEGLLLVRGLGMMQGYLGESKATQAVFRDGWYVTGDIVLIDPDGFLFFKGRA